MLAEDEVILCLSHPACLFPLPPAAISVSFVHVNLSVTVCLYIHPLSLLIVLHLRRKYHTRHVIIYVNKLHADSMQQVACCHSLHACNKLHADQLVAS
jgi:hypothetical protein